MTAALILQLRFMIWCSCAVMTASRDGLMATSPSGPSQGAFAVSQAWPDDGHHQSTHLWLRHRDQISAPFCVGS